MRYLVGIDLGSNGGIRAACFDYADEFKCIAYERSTYDFVFPGPSLMEFDIDSLRAGVIDAMNKLVIGNGIDADEIAGISVCGFSGFLFAVDEKGAPVFNILNLNDARQYMNLGETMQKLGELGIAPQDYIQYGFQSPTHASAISTLKQLDPEKAGKVKYWGITPHALATTALGAEKLYSVGTAMSFTGLANPYTHKTNDFMFEVAGITEDDVMPPMYSAECCGYVSEDAAVKTGLKAGTPVFVGGYDQTCQNIAQNSVHDGDVAASLGTTGVLSKQLREPAVDSEKVLLPYWTAFKDEDKWKMQAYFTCGGAYSWLKDSICFGLAQEAEEKGISLFECMNQHAMNSAVGSNGVKFIPSFYGDAKNPYARGTYLGISFDTTTDNLIRAVFEGTAMEFRRSIEDLDRVTGEKSECIRIAGGCCNSPEWMQIMADVCGRPILLSSVNSDYTGAMGAAIIAGVGAGLYSTVKEAAEKLVPEPIILNPIPENTAKYEELYKNYVDSAAAVSANAYKAV